MVVAKVFLKLDGILMALEWVVKFRYHKWPQTEMKAKTFFFLKILHHIEECLWLSV